MKIPIQNVYYLLCYAWNKLTERDVVAVDPIGSTSLADLFARVLLSGTNHLLKRGFDRGYVTQHEWTGRLRGRICFHEAIQRNATRTGRLPCEFDDLSYNVLHNQILKATMRRLIGSQGLEKTQVEGLAKLCRQFSEIEDIELNSRLFGQVQLHRNNQFYDFLLKVCELIYQNLLILMPKMQTDISLTSDTRKIIIDCKFTPDATKKHYEAEKLRSAHLYQINAYMDNLQGDFAETCEMMLLYPTVDSPLSATFTHKRHKIHIRTINLNQPWQAIDSDLRAIIECEHKLL